MTTFIPKQLLWAGGVVIVLLVLLYAASLLTKTPGQVDIVLTPSTPPVDFVKENRCGLYSAIVGIASCEEALDFVVETYGSQIQGISLLSETSDGQLVPAIKDDSSALPATESLRWYAIVELTEPTSSDDASSKPLAKKYILLKATDLSVLFVRP